MIVTFDDGARTHVEQWGTHGPAMVCVHGMTGSRLSWTRFAQHYSKRFRVFAYDQRGHGDSAAVAGPMTLDRCDADLRAVVAATGDVDVLAGHSWGGAVVLRGGRTTDARRVLAIDPVIFVPPDFDWEAEYVGDLAHELALDRPALETLYRERYEAAGWHPLDIEAKLHPVAAMSAEPLRRLNTENDATECGWDLRDIVRSYPKPLLLALAKTDESTVSEEERAWLKGSAGPNVRTVVFEDQGHSLHRTDFESFAREADAWLAATRDP